jgi:hypothetical protein
VISRLGTKGQDMKKIIIASLLITISLLHVSEAESNLRLELESSVRTVRLGQSTKLKLKIIGSGVYEITEGTEGINADNMKAGAFVYEFKFKPQKKGSFTFGPYAISVNGNKLNSNQTTINVLPQWDGTYGTFFRVDTNSIVLGEDIELVVETWAKKYDHKSISLDRSESYITTSGAASSASIRSGKEGAVTYMKRSWFISPKNSGEFKITREIFRRFPEDIAAPNITIKVKDTGQQNPGSSSKRLNTTF